MTLRILCVRSGFLGDVLMSTSALRYIKCKLPDSELTYATWTSCADLLALNPYVDELTRPGKYMVSDYGGAWVDFRHEALMDKYPDTYWGELHARNAAEAGLLDLDQTDSFKPETFIGPSDKMTMPKRKFAAVNIFTRNGVNWRLWSNSKWEELVGLLQKMGYVIVQLGGKDDPRLGSVDIQFCGKTSLAQSISVVSQADLVVAIDSFLAHVAHSRIFMRDIDAGTTEMLSDSTPCVLLAGPVPWKFVVPNDARCIPVSTYPDCDGPCNHSFATAELPICVHKNSCMRDLSVSDVIAKVEEISGRS